MKPAPHRTIAVKIIEPELQEIINYPYNEQFVILLLHQRDALF